MDDKFKGLVVSAGFKGSIQIDTMLGAGSNRSFYRVSDNEKSMVLISGEGHGADLTRWVQMHGYLSSVDIGVPILYAYDLTIPAIIVEDLGEMNPVDIEHYDIIINELIRMQQCASKNILKVPLFDNNHFEYTAFRQESDYFEKNYLNIHKKYYIKSDILKEFDKIALNLAKIPKYFCHRDFQSSNFILQNNRMRLIDFQSAKYGPLEYDLSSLLWDSRIEITEDKREELIEYYKNRAIECGLEIEVPNFYDNIYLCALSRTMQSLGAYCFLYLQCGKTGFKNLIEPAERHLRELIERTSLLTGLIKVLQC